MSAQTAAFHCPTELTFLDADDRTNIVHYSAPSKSQAGAVNTVGLDILTGETFCTCKGAECGKVCWHQTLVQAAWDGSQARQEVRWLTDAKLLQVGRKAKAFLTIYRARCGRALPLDQTNLLAARSEYRSRQARVERMALAA